MKTKEKKLRRKTKLTKKFSGKTSKTKGVQEHGIVFSGEGMHFVSTFLKFKKLKK